MNRGSISDRFYKGRVALNVLASDIHNAKELYEAAEGYILIGMLSKHYPNEQQAALAMQQVGEQIDHAVSIGLGGGDARQATVVANIVKAYTSNHINQVFPAVGLTRGNLGGRPGWINSLVSPTGRVGYVDISTGVLSGEHAEHAIVPVKAAIALVRDMGGDALKYYPMEGLARVEEYRAVCAACGEERMALEPTGGIELENVEDILSIALEANVPQVIPHVYSSIIDPESGRTRVDDVRQLFAITRKLVDAYEG